jgi:hypothetical protein
MITLNRGFVDSLSAYIQKLCSFAHAIYFSWRRAGVEVEHVGSSFDAIRQRVSEMEQRCFT